MTPDAESSPKALPPDNTIACAIWTRFTGFSKSVSRVAGADPLTSTPAVTPASARITVQPVGRSASVWCPTLMPRTAVSVWLPTPCATAWTAAAASSARTPQTTRTPIRLSLFVKKCGEVGLEELALIVGHAVRVLRLRKAPRPDIGDVRLERVHRVAAE